MTKKNSGKSKVICQKGVPGFELQEHLLAEEGRPQRLKQIENGRIR